MGTEIKRCLILCAGELPEAAWKKAQNQRFALVIAADGGWMHARRLNIRPDLILGDFDSSPSPDWEGVPVKTFLPQKDDTDTMLAVKEGLSRGCGEFWILGGMGGRFDHTVANLQALEYLAVRGCSGWLLDGRHSVTVLRGGSLTLTRPQSGYLSVFSLSDRSEGVSLRGVEYPLENGVLERSFPLGVSNHIVAEQAEISVASGTLLIVLAGGEA